MCGILGFVHLRETETNEKPRTICRMIRNMAESIKHRGPNDEGYLLGKWECGEHRLAGGPDTPSEVLASRYAFSPHQRISDPELHELEGELSLALACRRLSILDLSPAGHQPMCNEDQTIWVVHNGEIYNYRVLRNELKASGHQFVSDADTEVIVHAYEEWGKDCLTRFNGMWASVIWDSKEKKLLCSRDRFGVKPFYYHLDPDWFIFASEIKAILRSGLVPSKPNNRIIHDYLLHKRHDHASETFFEGIRQLRGGEYLELHLSGTGFVDHGRYWDISPDSYLNGQSDEEYAQRFYELLEDAVRLRLISDVPVGTCLSGGLDSSSIVCVLDKLLREGKAKIPGRENIQKTFSARYRNSPHDEGKFIENVAQRTAIDAHHIYPEDSEIFDEIQRLIYYQEEPFATLSIFAQWNVFKLARQVGVTVTLDGQGADESLAGYHTAFIQYFAALIESSCWLRLRNEMNCYKRLYGYSKAEAYNRAMAYLQVRGRRMPLVSRFLRAWMPSPSAPQSRTDWISPSFLKALRVHQTLTTSPYALFRDNLFDDYLYTSTIKPGLHHLLHYEDRNSMAFSIESRTPFLDYRLIEYLFAIPSDQKIRQGVTKVVLRNAMKGVLPEPIRQRLDKIGFSTPQDVWFRTILKETTREIFNSASFRQRPYFEIKAANQILEEHSLGNRDYSQEIWRALCLELWLRTFVD